VHHSDDEAWHVLDGELAFRYTDRTETAGPGTTVFVPAGVTVFRLIKPGGLRAVVAESVLTRHQILILNRSRKRAPSLHVSDRIIAGLCTLLMRPSRVLRCGMVLKPSTLLHFHHVLTKRKYRMLFSWLREGL
jgi:hypothetical protein